MRKNDQPEGYGLSSGELEFCTKSIGKNDKKSLTINQYNRLVFIRVLDDKNDLIQNKEVARKAGNDLLDELAKHDLKEITIAHVRDEAELILAFAEGMALGNYRFLKYFSDKDTVMVGNQAGFACE